MLTYKQIRQLDIETVNVQLFLLPLLILFLKLSYFNSLV